jgi:peptidase E
VSGAGAIACIGGGGFLTDDTRGLQERYLLSLVRPAALERPRGPRVLYVGTGMGDSERNQLRAWKMFDALGCEFRVLPFFPYEMARDYAAEARAADLIYVGGGNTVAMVAVWREFGFDRALHDAWQAGTVLAGISAGANCWFEHYVTDSLPGGGVRAGLGWMAGTFCPHVDGEPWRQPLFEAAPGLPAYAAPDGAILAFRDGALVEAVSDREGAHALVRLPGEAGSRPVPARPLSGG